MVPHSFAVHGGTTAGVGDADGEAFTGAGQGVHVQFYTEVARALESVEEQNRLRVWMDEAGAAAVVTERR